MKIFKILIGLLFLAQPLKAAELPPPGANLNSDIMQALSQRQTTRKYAEKPLSRQQLSDILWAANGVNRKDGKRTAPAAYGKQYINIYLIDESGSYRYDAASHTLTALPTPLEQQRLSSQGHVKKAPHVILLTCEIKKIPGTFASDQEKLLTAHATAGCICQNIYLACAAQKIGTCMVGGLRSEYIRKMLNEEPLYAMPVGPIN